jgi:hypothetical protein
MLESICQKMILLHFSDDCASAVHVRSESTRIVAHIRSGQNAHDMSFCSNSELCFDNGLMILNGDTGIGAGIKDDLELIIGPPRAMPLLTSVAGPGNNAMYTIPEVVGIRICDVKLMGSPSQKQVIVQLAITTNSTSAAIDSIFSPPLLVQ